MKNTKNLNIKNARTTEQLEKMKKLQKNGICAFCRKNFEDYHNAPILKETEYWIITNNDYPYDGLKKHFLLVYKEHIQHIDQINIEGFVDFLKNIKWINKKFKIKAGSLFIRFGDIHYTAASISHLHAHILVEIKQNSKSEKIKVPLAFKKALQ